MPTQKTQDPPTPALRRLTLTKETLRRLTSAQLRMAAGGRRYHPPRTGVCTL